MLALSPVGYFVVTGRIVVSKPKKGHDRCWPLQLHLCSEN